MKGTQCRLPLAKAQEDMTLLSSASISRGEGGWFSCGNITNQVNKSVLQSN